MLTHRADILQLLAASQVIALVGASDKPQRASHRVMAFLQAKGYQVIPINPRLTGQTLLGQPVLASLTAIQQPVDIVDVFLNPEQIDPVVDQAIAIGAKALWLQLGVINQKAVARAEAAGLSVVMDRCPKIELGG